MKSLFRKLKKSIAPTSSFAPSSNRTSGPREDEPRRRHAQEGCDWIESFPIDPTDIARIERLRPSIAGLEDIVVYRPHLLNGATTQPENFIFAVPPELAPIDDQAPEAPYPSIFEWDGTVCRAQVKFPVGSHCYGTGEVAGPLLRTGRAVTFWNIDAWRYGEESSSLYQSHPYVMVLLPDGRALGILAHSIRRGGLACAKNGVEFHFEDEPFDLWVIPSASPEEAVKKLAILIGKTALPPLWALGYHQCRWSYMTAEEVRSIADDFRAKKIPCDTLWLDIDHSDRFRAFTFDPERFADPEAFLADLKSKGFHVVAIADPGQEVADDHAMYREGIDGRHFVEDSYGRPWRGRCWPGVCHFPDFTRAATRRWWAGHAARYVLRGIDGLWNDMNEPSIFRTPTRTMPEGLVHRGFGGGSHARFHNVYGQLMVEATRDGLIEARPEKRPFVLTRSGFLGIGRLAAVWTGDNQARREDLAYTIPMILNLGISGVTFAGPDLGGYDGDPSPDLFLRWFEIGAFLPFCRGHSEKGACRKEPWSFGPKVEKAIKEILERRMTYLPYLYTLMKEAEESGLPPMRPMFFADATDPELRAIDDQFLLGADLLIAPVLEKDATERWVRLPKGRWFDVRSGTMHEGRQTIPVAAMPGDTPIFARGGSIIVRGPVKRFVDEKTDEPYRIDVWLDANGRAEGRHYEDSGDGYEYRRGEYCDRRFLADRSGRETILRRSTKGAVTPPDRRIIVTVNGPDRRTYEGKDQSEIRL